MGLGFRRRGVDFAHNGGACCRRLAFAPNRRFVRPRIIDASPTQWIQWIHNPALVQVPRLVGIG